MPGFPTGGVLLADCRVSFIDPSTRRITKEIDGLQKVHPVAPNLAVAFSGSVEAGLFIADQLRLGLAGLPPGELWSPANVAHQCTRQLKHLWKRLHPKIRAGGCELLLIGAFPSSSPPPFANSDAYRFRAPDFKLEQLPRAHASSIGSGSDVQKYAEMIESFAEDHGQLSQFSLQPFPGGPGGPMSMILAELINENPTPGISSQLVLCKVGLTESGVYTSESARPELTTPPLASTLDEFRKLCADSGLSAAAAIAGSWRPAERFEQGDEPRPRSSTRLRYVGKSGAVAVDEGRLLRAGKHRHGDCARCRHEHDDDPQRRAVLQRDEVAGLDRRRRMADAEVVDRVDVTQADRDAGELLAHHRANDRRRAPRS
jgi:hypothetical protein